MNTTFAQQFATASASVTNAVGSIHEARTAQDTRTAHVDALQEQLEAAALEADAVTDTVYERQYDAREAVEGLVDILRAFVVNLPERPSTDVEAAPAASVDVDSSVSLAPPAVE